MAKAKRKQLVFVIEYRVYPEYANTEELLDRMRETGDAEVVDTRVEEAPE